MLADTAGPYEKGGSDYHNEGECVEGECAPST